MNFWDSKLKIVHCENFNDKSYKLYILPKVKEKIDILMKTISTLEWSAYLLGNIVHSKKMVYVTDLILPLSQYNTIGNVDDIEMDMNYKYIGVIHSHHSMGAFFSGPDDQTVNKNHTVSIVVSSNKQKPMASVVRGQTKCGSMVMDESPEILQFNSKTKYVNEFMFVQEIKKKVNHITSKDIKPIKVNVKNYKNEFEGYGVPLYNRNYKRNNISENYDNWMHRYLNVCNVENDDDLSSEYSDIIAKLRTDLDFKEFLFKELINDGYILRKFKDVIIKNMIDKKILKSKGNKYNPKSAELLKQRINENNKKRGLIFN